MGGWGGWVSGGDMAEGIRKDCIAERRRGLILQMNISSKINQTKGKRWSRCIAHRESPAAVALEVLGWLGFTYRSLVQKALQHTNEMQDALHSQISSRRKGVCSKTQQAQLRKNIQHGFLHIVL